MTKVPSFDAGASLAGYIFQCRLALLHGLFMAKKKPNGQISIEKFDDVAFEGDDLSKSLIQAKHHISPKSLDDKSVDLWKTIRVWMSTLHEGVTVLGRTKFILITTSKAKEGSAAALLRPGRGGTSVSEAYELLCTAASESRNKETKAVRADFLKLKRHEATALLEQVEVMDLHPNLADVTSELEGELILVSPTHTSQVLNYLEGWWLNVVGKCLVEENSASIPVQHIITKAHEIGKLFGKDALPIDSEHTMGAKRYTSDDEDQTFVKQMRALGLPQAMVERGARDYYRAFAQRSKWARESLILDDELLGYDDRLQDRWERKFDEELLISNPSCDNDEVSMGRKIFLWAAKDSVPIRNVVEIWITSGSYHGLANDSKIFWHPKFKESLKENGEEPDA